MKFSEEASQRLRAIVDKAVAPGAGPDGIPGATVVIFSKDGSEPFVYSAGKRGIASKEDLTPDNVFWIASCTKMLTGMACMQLVEKGVLKLDDSSQLEELCPELRSLKVLAKNGELVPKTNGITLRMLLTHMAGFGYSTFSDKLRDWGYPAGMEEFSEDFEDFNQPLLFQPGEGWAYGINLDWAGVVIERAANVRLDDYIQENICRPLGLEHFSMLPTQEMKEKLVFMHQRLPSGKLVPRDHLMRRPLVVQEQKDRIFHNGGGGIFAKPQEYCRVLSVLLNNGTCPRTGGKLLEPATVEEMFKNQIPQLPQFGRQEMPTAKPDLTNPLPELYPTEGNSPQGWGLSFMLTGGATGRSAGTAWWAGLANL